MVKPTESSFGLNQKIASNGMRMSPIDCVVAAVSPARPGVRLPFGLGVRGAR
jgi:hypothetical protein